MRGFPEPAGEHRHGEFREPHRVFSALLVRCTKPFNVARLPVGLQIAGRLFDEATVLRAGHAYEQATQWHACRPADPG